MYQPKFGPKVSANLPQTTLSGVDSLVVVGFSARACAQAVAALAHHPIVVDHFGDLDCRRSAKCLIKIDKWGASAAGGAATISALVAEIRRHSHAPPTILLAGGTENWPQLLEALSEEFEVLGPNPQQMNKLRDWRYWRELTHHSPIGFPDTEELTHSAADPRTQLRGPTRHSPPPHDFEGTRFPVCPPRWLIKNCSSAGGMGVRRWPPSTQVPPTSSRDAISPAIGHLKQAFVAGRVLGIYCVLHSHGVQFLGASEALQADRWPGPTEFAYRGSFGPIALTAEQIESVVQLADQIRKDCQLCGWLQLDCVEDSSGRLWLLEINPRWTAGMELLVKAGINPVLQHVRACQGAVLTPYNINMSSLVARSQDVFQGGADPGLIKSEPMALATGVKATNVPAPKPEASAYGSQNDAFLSGQADLLRMRLEAGQNEGAPQRQTPFETSSESFGKAVVYAPRALELTRSRLLSLSQFDQRSIADVPSNEMRGQVIPVGHPILTVLAATVRAPEPRTTRTSLLERLTRLREHILGLLYDES